MTEDHQEWMRPAPDQQAAPEVPAAPEVSAAPEVPAAPAPRIREGSFAAPQPDKNGESTAPRPTDTSGRRRLRPALIGAVVAATAVVVAAIVLVLHPGSGTPPTAAAGATDDVTTATSWTNTTDDAVKALFHRRAQALLSGDKAAWLADIDPKATDVIARETRRFDNLRLLGLKSFDEVSHGCTCADSIYKTTEGRATVSDVMQLNADIERSETVDDWQVSWDGTRLLITGAWPTTTPYAGNNSVPNPPWEDVSLRAATANGVTILAPATGKWNPQTYLQAATKAAALVRSLWGKQRGVPGFVIFLADHQQFGRWLLSGGKVPGGAIGVTTFPRMVEPDGGGRFAQPDLTSLHKPVYVPHFLEQGAGSRIVLDMTAIHSVRETEQVMAHEMTHAMGPNLIQTDNLDYGTQSGPSVVNQGTWPIEGYARYVEYLDNPSYAAEAMRFVRQHRAYHPEGPFPPSKGFYDGSADRGEYNYDLSSSMFLAADQTGGREKAMRLYVALTNSGEALSDTEMFIDPLLEQVGLSPARVWAVQHSLTGS